ncbi:MAG: App1 family protein [Roseibacillus sp.]
MGEEVILRGRVERKKELRPSDVDDSKRRNFLNMAAHFFTKEIPYARVEGRVGEKTFETVCDGEGYFSYCLNLGETSLAEPEVEFTAHVLLSEDSEEATTVSTKGTLSICPDSAQRIIISDIDDTVMESGAAKLWQLLRNTLLENVHTRRVFPGVSRFYRDLQGGACGGEANPIFYVTSSPWNLRDFILKVFELRGTPSGPLFMTDWGIDETKVLKAGHSDHKLEAIRHLLDFHQPLPAVLIGDSGEKDPEIYSQVVADYPGRISAIFIRHVSDSAREKEVTRLGEVCQASEVPFHLVSDTDQAEALSRSLGLVAR